MKKILLLLGTCIFLGGCATISQNSVKEEKVEISVGNYTSNKGTLSLKENNAFSYSLTDGSSGEGTYTISDNEIMLTEDNKTYYFIPKYRSLTFDKDKSDALFSSNEILTLPASFEGDTVYMSSGETFDFSTFFPEAESIEVISYSSKDNIESTMETDNAIMVMRKSGRVTTYKLSGTEIRIVTSDGADEAVVKVNMKDGSSKEINVKYDCNCG